MESAWKKRTNIQTYTRTSANYCMDYTGAAEPGGLGGQAVPPPRFAWGIYKMIGLRPCKYEFDDANTGLPHHFFASCSAPELAGIRDGFRLKP